MGSVHANVIKFSRALHLLDMKHIREVAKIRNFYNLIMFSIWQLLVFL